MQISVLGIGWYRREDYGRLKAIFEDGSKLPDTFDSWLQSAQNLYDTLTSEGHVVIKAHIDPNTFPEWCQTRGLKMNGQARSAYGSEYAASIHRAQQGR